MSRTQRRVRKSYSKTLKKQQQRNKAIVIDRYLKFQTGAC